jgi:hypothetical protein
MNNGAEIRGLLRNAPKSLKGLANDPARMFQSLIEESTIFQSVIGFSLA